MGTGRHAVNESPYIPVPVDQTLFKETPVCHIRRFNEFANDVN